MNNGTSHGASCPSTMRTSQLSSSFGAVLAATLVFALALMGCGPDGAPGARRALLADHVPIIKQIIRTDRERTRRGVMEAAHRFRGGFSVVDPESREAQMRYALRSVQEPPRGIPEFIASPMSFLAAIDQDGVVICRDGGAEHDHMRGQNYGERFEVVRDALAGEVGYALGEFTGDDPERPSYSMLFAAPSRNDEGEIVGVMLAGIPLWREAQRISRQMRVDLAQDIHTGLILWTSLYKGDRTFLSPDAPTEIVGEMPDAATRREGLARSPGGFTGEEHMYHKWYGYAVIPIPTIGPDVGIIVYRADPPE